MPALNPLQRQPSNLDYARPTQFRFTILKVPNVEYFTTGISLPGIAFSGDAVMNTRYKPIPFMGDTINFEPLEVTFMVQEDLTNYIEIHNWMTGIGFPKSTQQFADAVQAASETKPGSTSKGVVNPSSMVSDATLTLLTNKNNPCVNVMFKGLYPTSLSALNFNSQETDTTQLTATVTFNYDLYEIEVL